ncbi:MAG: hypothetical protein KJZ83_15140 [Burkholderiaceae bacterium]|nr:hypothetical protein [Burkholderiaceae bacterium]
MAELIKRVTRSSRETPQSVPSSLRAARAPKIDDVAVELLESLPPALRLVGLRGQFPRILNRIAQAWPEPRSFAKLIDSLLIDDRGNREGFPFEVIKEITELRRYYFAMVHPQWRDPRAHDTRPGIR